MLKTVFMGTPEFAVPSLEAISKTTKVVAVYTQPDRPAGRGQTLQSPAVKKKALELGIPVFQPNSLKDPAEVKRLEGFSADLFIVAAYAQILKKEVLQIPKLACINVHSSLLPRWRGAAPISWAVLAGDSVSGVSIMEMAEALDAGPVYAKKETIIEPIDTAKTLHDRLSKIGAELLIEVIERLESGTATKTQQDESLVTYAKKLTKSMERISPEFTAQEVDRRVRGLVPWPGTSIFLRTGKRIKIVRGRPLKTLAGKETPKPGVFCEWQGMLLLGLREGAYEVLEIQLEGKPVASSASFLNGVKSKNFPYTLPEEFIA